MARPHHLLIYHFGPSANFEGHLVGAFERMDATGEARVLDGIFVANDPETGELSAVDLPSGTAGDAFVRLLTFRLEHGERARATERALGEGGSLPADVVRDLGAALTPGSAALALLIDGPEGQTLQDAVARTGGVMLGAEPVESSRLAEHAPELRAALASRRPS
jgi:hypothetical protein